MNDIGDRFGSARLEKRFTLVKIAGVAFFLVWGILAYIVIIAAPHIGVLLLVYRLITWMAWCYQRVLLTWSRSLGNADRLGLLMPWWVAAVGFTNLPVGVVWFVLVGLNVGWLIAAGLTLTGVLSDSLLPIPVKFFLMRMEYQCRRGARRHASRGEAQKARACAVLGARAATAAEKAAHWGWL